MVNQSSFLNHTDHTDYNYWLTGFLGKEFYCEEISLLQDKISNIFGFHILQIGTESLDYLSSLSDQLKINHRIVLSEKKIKIPKVTSSVLNCKAQAIPLDSNSIDAVLIAHGLEFSSDPHSLLREVDRILLPEGYVIILGFNPWSFWGLKKKLSFKNKIYPWHGKWLSSYRICDWLSLLNYDVTFCQHYFYRPCINNQNILSYTKFFDSIGKIIPLGSAGFCIIATKKQEAFELIRPRWSNKLEFVGKTNYIEPSM
ncbi:MAG: class I SAM-dependent methyltransferase [Gammaproteobacteria bacterium]|nr:class I SAM-dependent methyltransferase [Gammaproteobacteria bacterium]